jgi:hypothetical protein
MINYSTDGNRRIEAVTKNAVSITTAYVAYPSSMEFRSFTCVALLVYLLAGSFVLIFRPNTSVIFLR